MATKRESRINILGVSVNNLQLAKQIVKATGVTAILVLTSLLAQAYHFGNYGGKSPQKAFQNGQASRTISQMMAKSPEIRRINATNAVMRTIYALIPVLKEVDDPEEEMDIIEEEVDCVAEPSGPAKILSENEIMEDSLNRLKSEKGKAAQSLGIQQTAPIYKPGVFALKVPIKGLNLALLWEHATIFWDKLDTGETLEEAFRHEMVKVKEIWDHQISLNDPLEKLEISKMVHKDVEELTINELLNIQMHTTFMEIFGEKELVISERVTLETPNGLTPLEEEMGFISRKNPQNNIQKILEDTNRKSRFIDAGMKQLTEGDKTAKKTKRSKKKNTTEKQVWDVDPGEKPKTKDSSPKNDWWKKS